MQSTMCYFLSGSVLLWLIAEVACIDGVSSIAHSVFLNPAEDHFLDPYIEKIIRMDHEALLRIPQLEDDRFLFELNNRIMTINEFLDDDGPAVFNDILDDQIMAQDSIDAEWGEMVEAGPIAVNFMANVMIIASKRDFPFILPPNLTLQFIRYPNSFHATMGQVASDMYHALLAAHTSMNYMQLSMQQIPVHVKTAFKIIVQGSPKLLVSLLPRTLSNLARLGNDSASMALSTLGKFESLQNLLAEVIGLGVNTHSTHQQTMEKLAAEIEKAKRDRQQLDDNMNQISGSYESSRIALDKARQDYNNANNAIPSARFLKKFLRRVVRAVGKIISAAVDVLGCILGSCPRQANSNAIAVENAKLRAREALERLKEAEQRYEKLAQQQISTQYELLEIIDKIAALDLTKVSNEELVEILSQAVSRISNIRDQWGRLIRFFSKLSSQAESTQQVILSRFIDVINDVQNAGLVLNESDRELFLLLLFDAATDIERGAHLLYIMSRTYCDVSDEFLMDQIATIHRLLLLETDSERTALLSQLNRNSTDTTMKIVNLARERQQEYAERNKVRQQEYLDFLADPTNEDIE